MTEGGKSLAFELEGKRNVRGLLWATTEPPSDGVFSLRSWRQGHSVGAKEETVSWNEFGQENLEIAPGEQKKALPRDVGKEASLGISRAPQKWALLTGVGSFPLVALQRTGVGSDKER